MSQDGCNSKIIKQKKGNNRGMIQYKNPVDIRDKEDSRFKPYKVVNTLSNEELYCLMTTSGVDIVCYKKLE